MSHCCQKQDPIGEQLVIYDVLYSVKNMGYLGLYYEFHFVLHKFPQIQDQGVCIEQV